MSELIPQREMNKVVSHLRPVTSATERTAREIAAIADARLAPHKKTFPGAHIVVSTVKPDAYASLVDKAALSIEFGHFLGNRALGLKRRYIPGLHLFLDWYGD